VAEKMLIRVGHSPDPDDAFMFFALAANRIDTGPYRFVHELCDIETLNQRALTGELELTAVSIHAYAYLTEQYMLCRCGASMGDRYGPMVVTRAGEAVDLKTASIAVPGRLTTAFLVLQLYLQGQGPRVTAPFDQIIKAVVAGRYGDAPVDAGLLIHEGQLTYKDAGLELAVDLGRWWHDQTGLPLPLGANAVRKDLGPKAIADVHRLLLESIRYGLEHRDEALDYAMKFGRDLDREKTDRFVGMYVNQWTLDFGRRGIEAVAALLARGYAAGVLPRLVEPEFVPREQ